MKFVLLFLAISQIFAMRVSPAADSLATSPAARTENSWYVFDPVWYTYDPIFYAYTSDVYYYWDSYYYPSYWTVWRQDGTAPAVNAQKEKVFKQEDAQKELSSLKKEIWGKEDFNTENVRKNKIYDPRWLMAQLKIARAVNLEDMLKSNEQKKNLRTEATSAAVSENETDKPKKKAEKKHREGEAVEEQRNESESESEADKPKKKAGKKH